MNNNIAGQNIQYVIIDCQGQNESNVDEVLNSANIKMQLPKNAILFTEFDKYYQMYIVDSDGNSKPIQYPLTDSFAKIQNNISSATQNLENKLSELSNTMNTIVDDTSKELLTYVYSQKSYILDNITQDTINSINQSASNLKSYIDSNTRKISQLELKLAQYSYSYSYNSLDHINNEIYGISQDLLVLKSEVSKINTSISSIKSKQTQTDQRLTALEQLINPSVTSYSVTLINYNCSIVPGNKQTVPYNGSATWTVTPADGYMMPSSVDGLSINGNEITVSNVTENKTINFSCIEIDNPINQQYTVTLNAGGCTYSPRTNKQTVGYFESVSWMINPDNGYMMPNSVDGAHVLNNKVTVSNVTKNMTITVLCQPYS